MKHYSKVIHFTGGVLNLIGYMGLIPSICNKRLLQVGKLSWYGEEEKKKKKLARKIMYSRIFLHFPKLYVL